MKKLLLFTLVLLCIFAVSCGKNEENAKETNEIESTQKVEETREPEQKPKLPDTEQTKTMKELDGSFKTMGRSAFYDSSVSADWSGCGIEFNAYCVGDVFVNVTLTKIEGRSGTPGTYLTVYIDGKRCEERLLASGGTNEIKIASDLTEGEHSFGIYRQTHNIHCNMLFDSIKMRGYLTEKPKDRDLYIEFLGDSITCGYGDIINPANDYSTFEYSDATSAYAFLCAEKLNADYSILARCSWGIITADIEDGNNIPDIYKYICYSKNKTDFYDFENARKPDIVVINLGTNDQKKLAEYGEENYIKRTIEFVNDIRAKNTPDVPIIFVTNMMADGCMKQLLTATKQLGGEENGIYFITMKQDRTGGGNHPSLQGQKLAADKLAKYIKETVLK